MIKYILILIIASNILNAKWYVTIEEDEMVGTKSCNAISEKVFSTKPMDFPYKNTQSYMVYTITEKGGESFAFKFTKGPNIVDEGYRKGQRYANRRVKFDDSIKRYEMFRERAGKEIFVDIYFLGKDYLPNMKKSSTLLTEFKWYRQGLVYFKHDISGFNDAYTQARQKCLKWYKRNK